MSDEAELTAERSLRDRLGGRWALSWQAFVITGVLGLIALIAGEQYIATNPNQLPAWLLLFIAGAAALSVIYVLLDVTIYRNRRLTPVPVWLVVAVNAFMGFVYGLVVSLGAARFGLDTDVTIWERVTLDALFAAWWGPSLVYFLDYREQAKAARDQLITAAVQEEMIRGEQIEVIDRLRQGLHHDVSVELSPAKLRIEERLSDIDLSDHGSLETDTDLWTDTSELVRGTAELAVRPLSKKLWAEKTRAYSETPWWALPSNILRYQPFRPFMYALVDILGTANVQIRLFGLQRGLLLTAVVLALIFVVMLSANALMRAFPRWHSWLFIGGIAALQITLVVRSQLREMWLPGSASAGWQLIQLVVGVLVVFVTSGFGAWSAKNEELRRNFLEDLRNEEIASIARSMKIATLAVETAQLLHGSVQTRLIACAMAIDRAGATGDQAGVVAALREVLTVLSAPVPAAHYAGTLSDEVQRKAALWDGLCTFTIKVDPGATTDDDRVVMTLGRVIEEAIANAIRHGGASHIEISVEPHLNDCLKVRVDDDGIGPTGGSHGIGSALLQQASAGRWTLVALNPGSRLEAVLASH